MVMGYRHIATTVMVRTLAVSRRNRSMGMVYTEHRNGGAGENTDCVTHKPMVMVYAGHRNGVAGEIIGCITQKPMVMVHAAHCKGGAGENK